MDELRTQELRRIAGQFQAGIGYNYDAALEKCCKKNPVRPFLRLLRVFCLFANYFTSQ